MSSLDGNSARSTLEGAAGWAGGSLLCGCVVAWAIPVIEEGSVVKIRPRSESEDRLQVV